MIPLKDHNPSGKKPWVTYFLMGINVAVFLLMLSLKEVETEAFFSKYGLIPSLVTSGSSWLTFITSLFVHGGLMHLAGNMLFLNIFGDNLEDFFGHFKFLLFYLVFGVVASMGQVLIFSQSEIPIIGASGAIAGIMGGYLALFPNNKVDVLFSFGVVVRRTTVPAYAMLFYWFIFQFLSGLGGLAEVFQGVGGVAYFSHIVGFVFGWLTARIFYRRNGEVIKK